MDSAEWFLLGGLICCALLLLDGYRRVTRRQRLPAGTPVDTALPGNGSLLGHTTPTPCASESRPEQTPSFTEGSLIGRTVNVRGRLETRETLWIEGKLEGDVAANGQRVVVGTGAWVAPWLAARELRLAGTASGQLAVSEHVVVEMGARLEGQLSTASLHCHEGAWLQGNFDISGRRTAPSHPVSPSLVSPSLASPCLDSASR